MNDWLNNIYRFLVLHPEHRTTLNDVDAYVSLRIEFEKKPMFY